MTINKRIQEIDEIYSEKIKQVKRRKNLRKDSIPRLVEHLREDQEACKRSLIKTSFSKANSLHDHLIAQSNLESSARKMKQDGFESINLESNTRLSRDKFKI